MERRPPRVPNLTKGIGEHLALDLDVAQLSRELRGLSRPRLVRSSIYRLLHGWVALRSASEASG
jgi:hypothetical protein